jgi:hypothetical protein
VLGEGGVREAFVPMANLLRADDDRLPIRGRGVENAFIGSALWLEMKEKEHHVMSITLKVFKWQKTPPPPQKRSMMSRV